MRSKANEGLIMVETQTQPPKICVIFSYSVFKLKTYSEIVQFLHVLKIISNIAANQ